MEKGRKVVDPLQKMLNECVVERGQVGTQSGRKRGSKIKERKFGQQELRTLPLILETKEENK